jgi:hypothetical protein
VGGSHRATTFVFKVRVRGTVKFFVQQVAPVCRAAGSFKVRAHRGVNRLPFYGTVHGRRLGSGTYVVWARSKKAIVFLKTIVVGSSAPTNVCPSNSGGSAGGSSGSSATASGSKVGSGGSSSGKSGTRALGEPRSSGVLGARAGKVLPGSGETQLVLVLVLASAILLLGLGSLPRQVIPHPGAAAFLVRRRGLVAGAGFTALTAFLVAYFLP